MGRAASGSRPKLHSRAESLSLESLEKSLESLEISRDSRAVGCESLDRENLVAKVWTKILEVWKICVKTFATHGAVHVQTFQTESGCGATHKVWT